MLNKAKKVAFAVRFATGRRALMAGVGPAIEHVAVLREGWDTIVDIGANRGQFALAAYRLNPRCIIHSFEPLQQPLGVLQQIFKGSDRVTAHGVAIAASSGMAVMHVAGRDDSSSLLPITERQVETFPGTHEVATIDVPVATLDDQLSPDQIRERALLKIDVQGAEGDVLRGCETLLHRFDAVYVECSTVEFYKGQALFDDNRQWLADRGFQLDRVGHASNVAGVMVQGDYLFRRQG